jgi:hypothetical protein
MIGNRKWDILGAIAKSEGAIAVITLSGIALLFIWAIFH